MARWFISRSPESCSEGELIAYSALSSLDDSWSVAWCYHYLDGSIQREGDFLILGPDGRLLVLEVKLRSRLFASTGASDDIPDQEGDEEQVQAQKAGVIRALQSKLEDGSDNYEMPWVVSAIFSAKGHSYQPLSPQQPFTLIGGPDHLRKLPQYWEEITSGGYRAMNSERILSLFHSVYGDASAEAEARFITETDKLLHERAASDISLLEALSENNQLLVHGGPGSGKSWMAQQHALQLALQGMRVLFLCYNKALGVSLSQSLPRMRRNDVAEAGGKITVRIWEDLSEELISRFASVALPEKPDAGDKEATTRYYDELLPSALLEAVVADGFEAPYDALVVDEAQDHRNDRWEIYFSLLSGREKSQMGIYYDPAQRPPFLSGEFHIQEIARVLPAKAHVRLLETRRYTRPLFDYLRSLESDETARLIEGLRTDHLLAGPEVIERSVPNNEAAKSEAGALLKEWFENGLVSPEDTLLLLPKHPFLQRDSLFSEGCYFANCLLVSADSPEAGKKGSLRVTSFNKAKGLDARAVVMLDTPAWRELDPDQRYPYWMAASRARQMLAVICC